MHSHHWPHQSFTAPFTTTGRSALVRPPPWHYAGWLLNVAFRFDALAAMPLVPDAVGRPMGTGCVHFADWQACTDGHELLDPVLSQYRETIVVLEIERPDGSRCMYCPAIWVDQDISMVRGLLQGWPKKMGSTWLTRSLPLDHPAAAPLRRGSKLGASLAVKDRRLFEAHAEFTGQPGRPLGFLTQATIGVVGWADLRQPEQFPELALVKPDIVARTGGCWHEVSACLRMASHPGEDSGLLGDLVVEDASAGWLGLTVAGARDA
ncbi:MAG: acetoacetate decarboxylase [Burkholderiales bacterium GWA2_64_37]|nr:MAG: acetoacetate decarboxylase [Burkholderiales bacterium GWA2_64_37]HCE92136.1 acetoacetate decarboxylase [Acidovorax sp.]